MKIDKCNEIPIIYYSECEPCDRDTPFESERCEDCEVSDDCEYFNKWLNWVLDGSCYDPYDVYRHGFEQYY